MNRVLVWCQGETLKFDGPNYVGTIETNENKKIDY